MLTSLCTAVLLALSSVPVTAASLTGLINTTEATGSSAVSASAVDQVQTANRIALADTVGGAQNLTEKSRTGIEEALKNYRELAEKEPETYLPNIAAGLNDLGILDSDENGSAAALLVGYVSLWICALLAHCRRPILIATKDMLISGTGH